MKTRLLLFCAVLLAGCAAAPVQQSPAALSATHGYVLLSMPASHNIANLKLRGMADKQEYSLSGRDAADPTAYGVWLRPGQYEIATWRGAAVSMPPLEVKAHALTDLGAIVPVEVGGYGLVLAPIHSEETRQAKDRTLAALAGHLEPRETIAWRNSLPPRPITPRDDPMFTGPGWLTMMIITEYVRHANRPPIRERLRNAGSVEQFLELARQIAPPLGGDPVSADGSRLLFRADLGQIRVREPDGTWSSRDTGTMHTITALYASPGLLLAGAGDGAIRSSTDDGRTWKLVARLGNAVVDIDRVGNRWMVLTASTKFNHLGIRMSDRLAVHMASGELSDIAQLKDFAIDSVQLSYWQPRGSGTLDGKAYLVSAFPSVHRFDLASSQWKDVTPPSTPIRDVFVSGKTGLVTATKVQGVFSKVFVSADGGETWTPVAAPSLVIDKVKLSARDKGTATRFTVGVVSGGPIEVHTYEAAGDRWSKRLEFPEGCSEPLWDASGNPAFCLTRTGSILRLDEKQKWVVEFAAE